jgi:hypothetical protein
LKQIELGSPEPVPVLFQNGCLAIDSVTLSDSSGPKYSFKLPNLEVADSLGEVILENVFGFVKDDLTAKTPKMRKYALEYQAII